MFGLTDTISTLILSLLGIFNIVLLIFPNVSKLKNLHWVLIKFVLIIVATVWIILIPEDVLECFFYIGGSFGLGFFIKGLFTKKMYNCVYIYFSYIAFSLVLLTLNQVIIFAMNLAFSYIVFLGLFFYSLNIKQQKDVKIGDSKGSKLVINILIFSLFFAIFSYLIFSLLQEGQIAIVEITLTSLFKFQSEYLTLLIVILVAIFTAAILIIADIFTQLKRKDDEQWYI